MTICAECEGIVARESRLCENHYQDALDRVKASMGKRPAATPAPPKPRLTAAELIDARAVALGRLELPTTAGEASAALGISVRTLSRVLPLAVERGYVVVRRGIGIASGPTPPPPAPDQPQRP